MGRGCLLLALSLTLSYALPASALNTQIYEKEAPKTVSFTAAVDIVRDISEDVEVFFISDQVHGAYTLPHKMKNYGAILKMLEDSRDKKTPVQVTVDDDSKVIKSVEKTAAKPAVDPVKDFDKLFK